MKKLIIYTLFLTFGMGIYAQSKTYIINIESLTLNSVKLSWDRADGTSEKDTTQAYTSYYVEYGIKGFERGKGITIVNSWAGTNLYNLIPDTEYTFFIRKQTVSADSPVWFEEYSFKTLCCNTSISNIKTEMVYANGINIKDLIDVHITFDEVADSYELEYGLKGFVKGSGTIVTSDVNTFSIGNANLKSNTEYDYYIRGKCNNVYGEWSLKNTFATTKVFRFAGSEAFDVAFMNITNKSATINWLQIVGSASKYYIEYGLKGFARGTGKIELTRMNSQYLSGLVADTEYSFFIRSYNKSSTDSVWFTEHTFKTLACNTEITGIKSSEVWTTCYCGASVIIIEWDNFADSYELEYGLKGFQKGTGILLQTEISNVSISPNLAGNDYDFYIRAKCNGVFGNWSAKNSFSTTDQTFQDIKNVHTSTFEIFPNPVGDILNIKLNSAFDINSAEIYIIDLMGLVRYKSECKNNYDISSLPAGTYVVRVKDKQSYEAKIIQKK